MEILKTIVFEYLLGYILQGFVIVLGVYAFNREKINRNKYLMTSGIIIIISYFVRLLPISFGVHTIINMLFLFLICTIVLKMPAYSTIRSALLVTVLLLVSEMADVAAMVTIMGKEQFENAMLDPLEKAMIGAPGSILFAILVIFAYLKGNKSKEK